MAQTSSPKPDLARPFFDDAAIALVVGTVLVLLFALFWAGEIPDSDWPGGTLRQREQTALSGALLCNAAWFALLGALPIASTALAMRRRRPWLAAALITALAAALSLPALMGHNIWLERFRWPLFGLWLAAVFGGSRATLVVVDRLLARSSRLFFWVLLTLALAVVAVLDWGLRRAPLYPALIVLVAATAQGALLACVRALPALTRTAARLRGWRLAAAVLVLPALLDASGVLDDRFAARGRQLFRTHAPGANALVELSRAARPELAKIRTTVEKAPPARDRVDVTTWPAPAADAPRQHVLLVVLDALRRDHVSAYPDAVVTTPNLERLASRCHNYRRAYSPAPDTAHAIPSILTGLPPAVIAQLTVVPPTVAGLLARRGYATTITASSQDLQYRITPALAEVTSRALGFNVEVQSDGATAIGRDRKQVDALFERLRTTVQPRFEYLHLLACHTPGLRGDVERYRAIVVELDREVGRIADFLEQQRLLDQTLLIVTADHGQSLGEHSLFGHNQSLYESEVAVPLIVCAPGAAAQQTDTLFDLTALAGLVTSALGERWPLDELKHQARTPELETELALQEQLLGDEVLWRSVRWQGWAFHRRYLYGTEELYELAPDPMESVDRIDTAPAQRAQLRQIEGALVAWEQRLAAAVNGMPTVAIDAPL